MGSTEEKLKERIKELSCLYEISSLFQQLEHEDETKLLHQVSQVLKKAWRFSAEAAVEIIAGKLSVETHRITQKKATQKSDIRVFNKHYGYVMVHYPSPRFLAKDFLEEEQKLLNKVALELGGYFEKKEQHKKEELLKRSAERNDRLTILGEITAGIAHELNTPLGNILGFAELINQQANTPSIQRDSQKIIEGAIFSREVVKKLMFFACEMPQNKEEIEIKPVIEQALSLLGQSFKKAEIKAKLISDTHRVRAQIDSIQLTQVLFNLLINAIYASPKGSQITCKLNQDATQFYITIADQGVGIAPENKRKIFDPFFTTKPVGEGSGLGLSVVHGIIKSHKGDISFTENIPRGTIFHISIPKKTSL
ncbi:sensor histidine kinase [Mesonia aquimarina]|uniref:sensor histidine kinase n=1 Tax=Mesonia aquimarina TaxID=1504967 RepID=UPI000EF600C1|nr:ATP-binding protein [Mesonia aquimarina]